MAKKMTFYDQNVKNILLMLLKLFPFSVFPSPSKPPKKKLTNIFVSREMSVNKKKIRRRMKNNRQRIRDKRFVSPLNLFSSSLSTFPLPPMVYYDTCVREIFAKEKKGEQQNGMKRHTKINIVWYFFELNKNCRDFKSFPEVFKNLKD